MAEKIYIYSSNGDGIAGLPHEISKEEAKAQGLLDALEAAIASGAYKVKGGDKPAVKEQSHGQ